MAKKLVIIGEYNPSWETHRLTEASIAHSQRALDVEVDFAWRSSENLAEGILEEASGLWIATGEPYKSMSKVLEAIRYARERNVPCLGTCQGFQHVILEYARSFLGVAQPGHEEYDAHAENPVISELSCSLRGQTSEIEIVEDSLVHKIYGSTRANETFYCRYGIHPDFAPRIEEGPIRISGSDSEGNIRIVEYPQHPFMIGTLFVPQAKSTNDAPHPLVTAFIKALLDS